MDDLIFTRPRSARASRAEERSQQSRTANHANLRESEVPPTRTPNTASAIHRFTWISTDKRRTPVLPQTPGRVFSSSVPICVHLWTPPFLVSQNISRKAAEPAEKRRNHHGWHGRPRAPKRRHFVAREGGWARIRQAGRARRPFGSAQGRPCTRNRRRKPPTGPQHALALPCPTVSPLSQGRYASLV